MILNEEQQSIIKMLVSNEVTYQETYVEVYDHILSTLEKRDFISDFQKAYAEVLEADFGGHSGIEKLEANRERQTRKEIIQKKWHFFSEFFKGPAIIISLVLGVFCYYGFNNKHFGLYLLCATAVMALLPFLFLSIGNLIAGLKMKNKEDKKRFNDDALYSAAVMVFRFLLRLNLIGFFIKLIPVKFTFSYHLIPKQVILIIEIAIFLFVTFYAVAVLRICKTEFTNRFARRT